MLPQWSVKATATWITCVKPEDIEDYNEPIINKRTLLYFQPTFEDKQNVRIHYCSKIYY